MISQRSGLFHLTGNYRRRSDPGNSTCFPNFPRSLRFLQSEWKIRLANRCSQTSKYRRVDIIFTLLTPSHACADSTPYFITCVYKGGHICCLERDFSSLYYAWVSPPILYPGRLATQYLLGRHIALPLNPPRLSLLARQEAPLRSRYTSG